MNKSNETGSMIIRKVPDDVRRAFKSICAAEGISQQDKVIELMAQYVKAKIYPQNYKWRIE